ncbi:MAG: hypothetical protein ACRDRT_02460 [Pseudonocardiaceae bacterium]
MPADDAASILRAATGRDATHDAVAWIAEGRALRSGVAVHQLLSALVSLGGDGAIDPSPAVLHLIRNRLRSAIDTSADLLGTDAVVRPGEYRAALLELRKYTTTRSLADVTAEAVLGAQAANSLVIEALCQVAGLSFRDLADRVAVNGGTVPTEAGRPWNNQQTQAAFVVIDAVVRGDVTPQLPGAVAARPVEMLFSGSPPSGGWAEVDSMLEQGVPYEVLLAQRAVGGAWLSHRNATTNLLPPLLAAALCDLLDERKVSYWRGAMLGGDAPKRVLGQLVGVAGEAGQVGLITKTRYSQPALAVAIAVARDGGTARKSAGKLRELPSRLKVPAALVLLGPGWATRGETADLVEGYQGRLFTEATLQDLSDLAASMHVVTEGPHNAA